MDPISIVDRLFSHPTRRFAVQLWNGSVLAPRGPAEDGARVILRRPRALLALVPPVSERRLAEAFIQGDVDVQGDLVSLLEAASRWAGPDLGVASTLGAAALSTLSELPRPLPLGRLLRGRLHSAARDTAAVRAHYDVSDPLYRLFLDPQMIYSCAYFRTGLESIDVAQQDKLRLICTKLGLRRGERFLDVGCGWGGLVCHAARAHGVRATGITLSRHQLAEARRRIAAAPGLSAQVCACDYRDLGGLGAFDKVASVGMMEHVGRTRLRAYFAAMFRALRPGGLFLNHAIADVSPGTRTLAWARRPRGGFIDTAIFPDAELLPIGEVITAAEEAGFEVRDLESLREHYDRTLCAWLKRLEAGVDRAVAQVGRATVRRYRLYLGASAAAFRVGRIGIFQLLLARRTESGRANGLPWSREPWYPPTPDPAPIGGAR